MLRPSMSDMLSNTQDCYSFVVSVAKRAREIADEAEENHEMLDEKPVQMAVNEFAEARHVPLRKRT
ncbi:MAG: DNA-directed RNA polymerase subunit omega [Oscillospiraceae bacterium]